MLSTSAHCKMNPILPPVTSSSSAHFQQQYDDEMYSILPRFEIPDVVLSSTLDRESESTSSIDKGEPSLKHAHNYDTDHDANITTKKTNRQHHHDCGHSDISVKRVHIDNDKTMTNNSNSSAAEIDSALTSMTTATPAQFNANNRKDLGIEMCSEVPRKGWKRRYEELIAFKQQYGHCNVPQRYAPNKTLGEWVSNQRSQYILKCKDKPSRMTAERQAALEEIGFEWRIYRGKLWQIRYDELVAFKQQYGHCNVPYSFAKNPALGFWVNNQRTFYRLFRQGKPSSMTTERQAALENIEFEWNRA